jgi:putative transposase
MSYIPRLFISSIVRRLKQHATYYRGKTNYRYYLKSQFWKKNTFWSDGYFVCSIGQASPETISTYIETQG